MKSPLFDLYDVENFKKWGHQLIDIIAEKYEETLKGERKTSNWHAPEEEFEFWNQFPENQKDPIEIYKKIIDRSISINNPNYIGHQVPPVAPATALINLAQTYINAGTSVYEMGASGTAIERYMTLLLAKQLGFGSEADGVFTSGGTLANLTALLTARAIKAPSQVWTEGHNEKLGVMVSEEAHYCIDRAARIMGLGDKGVIKLPTNDNFQLDISLLESSYQEAKKQGITVFAIIGSACSTSTGSYDNLEALAAFAKEKDIWFHVDGAHGAAVCFSEKYKDRIKGIQEADSMILDWHKMLLAPSLTTSIIYKKGMDAYQTFLPKAQYLWEKADEKAWHEQGKRTFECTRTTMGYRPYQLVKMYGTAIFDEYVTKMYDNTVLFYDYMSKESDFELPYYPQANILCYRFVPEGYKGNLNELNTKIRKILLEEGTFYVVMTLLNGDFYLRSTVMNPFTSLDNWKQLIKKIRTTAQLLSNE